MTDEGWSIAIYRASEEKPRRNAIAARAPGTVQDRLERLCHPRTVAEGHRRTELARYPRRPSFARIFSRTRCRYPAFADFYGMERTPSKIVSYLRHAAQGWKKEARSYRSGPVGGSKSSLAERLKKLMEKVPPFTPSPTHRCSSRRWDCSIPTRTARSWKRISASRAATCATSCRLGAKRLQEFNGDITQFRVVKYGRRSCIRSPSPRPNRATRTIRTFPPWSGKVDIRKQIGAFRPERPGRLQLSGALCRANRGPDGIRGNVQGTDQGAAPLLTATQEGNYNSTEGLVGLPRRDHSGPPNESEWQSFRNNKNNEAFLDRVYIVKVPYCLRVSDEVSIYRKLLINSSLSQRPARPAPWRCWPSSRLLSRIKEIGKLSIFSKMRVYDGENLKDTDPKAKSIQEYRDYAGVDEGMTGISTRFAFKIPVQVFNFDHIEVAANPVHLLYVLERQIEREQFPAETEEDIYPTSKGYLAPRYAEFIGKELQTAYLESYSEYGQNIFDRYVTYADFWIRTRNTAIPTPARSFDRAALNAELERSRNRPGISNPEGLPQRSSTSCCGRAPTTPAETQPGPATKNARGDREEDVLQHRGPAAGDQLQRQGQRRRSEEARRFRRTHGRQGLHGEAGALAVRLVFAGPQGIGVNGLNRAPGKPRMATLIDRRLDGKNKSTVNRQRFIRRFTESHQEGRDRGGNGRSITDIDNGEQDQHSRPRHRRAGVPSRTGRTANPSIPATRSSTPATDAATPAGRWRWPWRRQGQQQRRRRRRVRVRSPARNSSSFMFEDLELPNLVRTHLTGSPNSNRCAPASATCRQPANIDIVRSLKGPWPAHRAGRPTPADCAKRKSNWTTAAEPPVERQPRPRHSVGGHRTPAGAGAGGAVHRHLRPALHQCGSSSRNPPPKAVMFCLMDVSGSMDEAPRICQALSPCSTCFQAQLRENRGGVHPSPHQRQRGGRTGVLLLPRDRRHHRLQRAAPDAGDHGRALPGQQNGTSTAQASTGTTGTTIRRYADILINQIMPFMQYFTYVEITPTAIRRCGTSTNRSSETFPPPSPSSSWAPPTSTAVFQRTMVT